MNKHIRTVLIILIMLLLVIPLQAEESAQDMSTWSFKILLQHCDQLDRIKVTRYSNSASNRNGFCLEPEVNFNKYDYEYFKRNNDQEAVFWIVKAYESLGEDYFIGAQLMIWEELYGTRYSFEGKDAADYGEEALKNKINELKAETSPEPYVTSVNVKSGVRTYIEIENIQRYVVSSDDISDISVDEKGLYFTPDSSAPLSRQIRLIDQTKETDGSYVYHSEESQDLYSYEGDYRKPQDIIINVNIEATDISVAFTKTDEEGNSISGAVFTLYELDNNADDVLYIIQKGINIDLYEMLINDNDNYDRNNTRLEVSQRFAGYLDDFVINAQETGYFPFSVIYEDNVVKKGRVYVSDDPALSSGNYQVLNVRKLSEIVTSDHNIASGMKAGGKYLLCESEPQKGYTYVSEPCRIIDTTKEDYDKDLNFINSRRTYTLSLVKNNADKNLKLNGARFRMTYRDAEGEKEMIFVTGALNIKRDNDKKYVIFRKAGTDDIQVKEFDGDYFILKDAAPGIYEYYLSNHEEINEDRLKNNQIEVIQGGYMFEDLPYGSTVHLEELEAPKGYFIEEAEFDIKADIPYSEIVFSNYRVNQSEIIPENRRKIPKTCIGD